MHAVQETVDRVDQLRRKHTASPHKALIVRLLFILTRCSRLLLSGGHPLTCDT